MVESSVSAQEGNHATSKSIWSKKASLGISGTMKNIQCTLRAWGTPKRRYDASSPLANTTSTAFPPHSLPCIPGHTGLSKNKKPWLLITIRLNSSVYWVLFGPARLSAGLSDFWLNPVLGCRCRASTPNTNQLRQLPRRFRSSPNTKVRPRSDTPAGAPGSVSLLEATSRSSVACCGGSGPDCLRCARSSSARP